MGVAASVTAVVIVVIMAISGGSLALSKRNRRQQVGINQKFGPADRVDEQINDMVSSPSALKAVYSNRNIQQGGAFDWKVSSMFAKYTRFVFFSYLFRPLPLFYTPLNLYPTSCF